MTANLVGDGSPTVESYFNAFSPAPPWDDLPAWPPDMFALANLVLDHTQGYRFVVAPPPGRRWPRSPDWNRRVLEAARSWRTVIERRRAGLPELVDRCWQIVSQARGMPLARIQSGDAWDVCEALLTLHATADEACAWLSAPAQPGSCAECELRAWKLLEETGSLSHVSPARIRVVPKGRFTNRGITIRSLSRYMALCYETVDLRWNRVGPDAGVAASLAGRTEYNLVLVPWPLTVHACDFHPMPTPLGNMDESHFGFFEFAPKTSLDAGYVRDLLETARRTMDRVDAVVLPEAALDAKEVVFVEDAVGEVGATILIAGVRTPCVEGVFGRNYLHLGVRTATGWVRLEQDKHHRWSVDGRQIRQYHLGRSLDPKKLWWEAVDIRPRTLNVIDFGGAATTAPLVCEDLAQMDEVSDLLRRIGPTVVIAVLFDGPQLASRWPCRYACVLSEDPGSAVLTLTSVGMALRSTPKGLHQSRVIAMWRSSGGALEEIELGRGSDAVGITLSLSNRSVWTADGRCHADVPFVTLSRQCQLSVSPKRVRRGR
ncbi:MAG TPA: hypothetical protein VFL27_04850 [Candidatus Dormibacteraeota bacterium]|nr:hypothetical protein [Candidatus Dormibacteraeota bacterium]